MKNYKYFLFLTLSLLLSAPLVVPLNRGVPGSRHWGAGAEAGRGVAHRAEADPNALIHYVRTLIKLRNDHKTIGADADWKLLSSFDQPYPMVYERTLNGKKCIVALNPSDKNVSVEIPVQGATPAVIGGSYTKASYKTGKNADKITLSAVSAIIYEF